MEKSHEEKHREADRRHKARWHSPETTTHHAHTSGERGSSVLRPKAIHDESGTHHRGATPRR